MTSLIARAAVSSILLAFGCGSAKPAETPVHPNEATPAAADRPPPADPAAASAKSGAPPPSDAPDTNGQADSSDAKQGPAADAKKTAADDDSGEKGKKPREVTFQMTPTGLVIEVEGVRMEPKAEPFRVEDPETKKMAGWGVKLSVKVTATDGHVHRFTRPEHGSLMMAAEIDRKGKKEHIGDERKGEGEESVTQGAPITLQRTFQKPIGSGQSVTLFVGLWGLGRDMEEKRLIRKLFVVKMVAGNKKPAPVISPPE